MTHISPFPILCHISIDRAVRSARFPSTSPAYDTNILYLDGSYNTYPWALYPENIPSVGSHWTGGGRLSITSERRAKNEEMGYLSSNAHCSTQRIRYSALFASSTWYYYELQHCMRSVWLDGFWGTRSFPAQLCGFGPKGDISWDGTTEVYVDYRDRLSLF